LLQKKKKNELTQGQKKVCHSARTMQPELEKNQEKKKQINIKYLLISKQNKARQKINTQLN
jgi:hypothetical protein